MRLEPLEVWFQPAAGALLPQLRPFVIAAGRAQAGPSARLLRWAITAAEPARGLRVEAVLMVGQPGDGGRMTSSDSESGSIPGSGSGSMAGIDSGSDSKLGLGAVAASGSASGAPVQASQASGRC